MSSQTHMVIIDPAAATLANIFAAGGVFAFFMILREIPLWAMALVGGEHR